MTIDINDNLLESVKQELLVTLQSAENRVVDIFEFGETQGSDEVVKELSAVKNVLVMIGEDAAAALCDSLGQTISIALVEGEFSNENVVVEFLTLTEYVKNLSKDGGSPIAISQAQQLADDGVASYRPDERQKALLVKAVSKLKTLSNATPSTELWQMLYKIGKVTKEQMQAVESYELVWLFQHLAILNIKQDRKTIAADVQRAINCLADYLTGVVQVGERHDTYSAIKQDVEWLKKLTGSGGDTIKNDYNPPKNWLEEETSGFSIVFPVSTETIEAIAFFVKKELATVKSTFEVALTNYQLSEESVKAQLIEGLKPTWAAFDMLGFRAGERLVMDAETLIRDRELSDSDNTAEFAQHIVLIEDSLWHLHVIDSGGLLNSQEATSRQQKHALDMAVSGALVVSSGVAGALFKKTREQLLESFNDPTGLSMLPLAAQLHQLSAAATLMQKDSLADRLQRTEQIHLFLEKNKERLATNGANSLYLDVLVTYEIIYEQLEKSLSLNNRALKLLDDALQKLAAAIKFTREQMAAADYLSYDGGQSNADEDILLSELSDDSADITAEEFDELTAGVDGADGAASADGEGDAAASADGGGVAGGEAAVSDAAIEQALLSHSNINRSIESLPLDEVDEEILDIFLEEGEGIIALLEHSIPQLQADYHNEALIGDIRRAYHTLKGSGRMVGLNVFGEFAWQHEELFNRAIANELTLNNVVDKALLKSNEIIKQTLTSNPFKEDKDTLLAAAAKIEAIKNWLLGQYDIEAEAAAIEHATKPQAGGGEAGAKSDGMTDTSADESLTVGDSVGGLSDAMHSDAGDLSDTDIDRLSDALLQKRDEQGDGIAELASHPALQTDDADDDTAEAGDAAAVADEQADAAALANKQANKDFLKKAAKTAKLLTREGNPNAADLSGLLNSLQHVDDDVLTAAQAQLFDKLDEINNDLKQDLAASPTMRSAGAIANALETLSRTDDDEVLADALEKLAEATIPLVDSSGEQEPLSVGLDDDLPAGGLTNSSRTAEASNKLRKTPKKAATPKAQFAQDSMPKIADSRSNYDDWEGDEYENEPAFDELKGNIDDLKQGAQEVDYVDSQLVSQSIADTLDAIAASEEKTEPDTAKPVERAIDDLARMHQEVIDGKPGKANDSVLEDLKEAEDKARGGDVEMPEVASPHQPPHDGQPAPVYQVVGDQSQITADMTAESLPPGATPIAQPYLGVAGMLDEQIDKVKRQLTPVGLMTGRFDHQDLIDSLYDVEASIDANDTPQWSWELLSSLESTISSMQDKSLLPSPNDYQRVADALDAIKNNKDVDSSQAKKLNNELMNLRADLATRSQKAQQISDYAASGEQEIKAAEQSMSDWRQSGYSPDDSLSSLKDKMGDVGEVADATDYDEAKQLSSLVNTILERLHGEQVVPFDYVSDNVEQAVHEITDISKQFHGDAAIDEQLLSGLMGQVGDAGGGFNPQAISPGNGVPQPLGRPYDVGFDSHPNGATPPPRHSSVAGGIDNDLEATRRSTGQPAGAPSGAQTEAYPEARPGAQEASLAERADTSPDNAWTEPAYDDFARYASPHIKASKSHFDDWQHTGFSDERPLEHLSDRMQQLSGISGQYGMSEGAALGDSVGEILDRLYNDVVAPSRDTAATVSSAIEEFDRAATAISNNEPLPDQHIREQVVQATQAVASGDNLGHAMTLESDDYQEFSRRRAVAKLAPFAEAVGEHIEASKAHFDEWQGSDFAAREPLDNLSGSVKEVTDLSEEHDFDKAAKLGDAVGETLSRLSEGNEKPSSETAGHIDSALNEFERSANAIKNADGDPDIADNVLQLTKQLAGSPTLGESLPVDGGGLGGGEMTASINTKSADAEQSASAIHIDASMSTSSTDDTPTSDADTQTSMTAFAEAAKAPIKASKEHFDDWQASDFAAREPLDNLSGSVEEVTKLSQQHDFTDAKQLGDAVGETLSRLSQDNLKPSATTAANIDGALNEFERSATAISTSEGDPNIDADTVSAMQHTAANWVLGEAFTEKTAASGAVEAADGDVTGSDGADIGDSTDSASELDKTRARLAPFAEAAEAPIKASKEHFDDWQESDFAAREPLGNLSGSVKEVTDISQQHDFTEAKQLGDAVGETLSRLEDDNLKPSPETASHINGALNEFERSATAIKNAEGDPIINAETVSAMQQVAGAWSVGEPLGGTAEQIGEGVADDSISRELNETFSRLAPFAEAAKAPVKASKEHFDDWRASDFAAREPLDNLSDSVKEVTDISQQHDFTDAEQLGDAVGETLSRLSDDNLKPSAETATRVDNALSEFERALAAIQAAEGNPDIDTSTVAAMQQTASATVLGEPLPVSEDLEDLDSADATTDKYGISAEMFASLATFAEAAEQPIKASKEHFGDWQDSDFEAREPLDNLSGSVKEITDLSQQFDFADAKQLGDAVGQTLSRLNDNNMKPSPETAGHIDGALNEFERSAAAIRNAEGDPNIDAAMLAAMQRIADTPMLGEGLGKDALASDSPVAAGASLAAAGLAAAGVSQLADSPAAGDGGAIEGGADGAAESIADAATEDALADAASAEDSAPSIGLKSFADNARKHIDASKLNFDEWRRSDFIKEQPRDKLTGNVRQISQLSKEHDFHSAGELGDYVEQILQRLADEGIKPSVETAGQVESAIQEFDRSAKAIQANTGKQEVSSKLIEKLSAIAEMPNLGTPLGVGAVASAGVAEDAVATGGVAGGLSVSALQTYADAAKSHIEASRQSFEDWKQSNFSEDQPRNDLADNVQSISDISRENDFNDAAELGEHVQEILGRIADEGIKPTPETAGQVESAIDEFERSAQAINANAADQNIDSDVLDRLRSLASQEALGWSLGSGLSAYEEFTSHASAAAQPLPAMDEHYSLSGNTEVSESAATPIQTTQDQLGGAQGAGGGAQAVEEEEGNFNDPQNLDATILEIFLDEARDIVQRTYGNLDDWKADFGDLSALQEIQRGMHTLKGGARMAELTVLGDLSHYIETLLDMIVDGRVTNKSGAESVLRDGVNLSNSMVQLAERRQRVYESPEYLQELSDFIEAETGKKPENMAREAKSSIVTTTAAVSKPSAAESVSLEKEQQKRRSYSLRIQSDLIDKLSGLVGEDTIARARIERSTNEHGFQLEELSRTIIRVGEQLRRLESETETQILFQHDTGSNAADDFDPLELDRFSEIQQLSRLLAESMEDLQSIRGSLTDYVYETKQILSDQSNIQRELQDGILSASLVRFDSIQPRIEKMVNQLADELGKEVQVQIYGGQIDIERNMLEDLIPGFEHTIRNSLAHGLEAPEDREKLGKPRKGRIRIGVRREGAEIWFVIADDGRGANLDAIRDKARRVGILDEARAGDRDYLLQLLFAPGFTTAESTTQISGRGIGLDVLKDVVNARQGSIEVETEKNKGLATSIRMPFAMSITDALIVKVGQYTYAVPVMSIEGVARLSPDLYNAFELGQPTYYTYGQNRYKLESLIAFVDPNAERVLSPHGVPALLVRVGSRRIAFEVEEILNRQEVIIKTVNAQLTSLPGVIGAAIMDDGLPVAVLEAATLGRHFLSFRETGEEISDRIHTTELEEIRNKPRILVVDDSITMRKVTTKILSKYDVEIETAKDGLDAIDTIVDWTPDLILLDIEMPRMDGFEFATHVRNDSILDKVPIIMITSRTGDKHRERAESIGVNDYLGKPYSEDVLVNAIEGVLNSKLKK